MMDFASMCEIGQKENNNDFIGISEDLHCACFAVADGKNNAAASEIIINSVLNDFKSSAEITTTSIPNFFENAQKELRKEVTCRDPNLDCSMAVLMTNGEMAVWGHIGDCRIYLLREDLLYEITPDHSAAYAAYEAGDIRYPKIRRRRERHTLFRHFGANPAIVFYCAVTGFGSKSMNAKLRKPKGNQNQQATGWPACKPSYKKTALNINIRVSKMI